MRILFDDQIFTLQEFGGISRYFYELINRGIKDPEQDVDVSLLLSNNAYLNKSTYAGLHNFFPESKFRGKAKIINLTNRFVSKRRIGAGNYDVLHPTYYDTYFLDNIPAKKPFTVTFLDMIHEKFGHLYSQLGEDKGIFENKKKLLNHASKVIAISESTKNDIIEIFGTDAAKIDVIYLGSSFDSSQASAERQIIAPYLLFVGNRSIYKNFSFFIQSVVPVLMDNRELVIVCAGGGNFSDEEMNMLRELKINDRVLFRKIDDASLANMYKYAEAFVFPSLYEGFGIPVLEAFACGCPCLLSTGGSLPEVGGNAALYFNPENAAEIRDTVSTILNDSTKRADLITKGYERVGRFSWDDTYNRTLEFYKSII